MRIKNKKGFSLVELMIVVVIMGVLVAVAIPLYGKITDNARRNTCRDNQKLIRSCFSEWVLMDESNTAATLFKNGKTSYDASTDVLADTIDDVYVARFDDGKIPSCPDKEHHFRISYVNSYEIKVECLDENGNLVTEHMN